MADQIVLAFTVTTAGTPLTPTQAEAKLAAVPLYTNPVTDPVLGQLLGLTVASDATSHDSSSATRTLTLNMTPAAGAPSAPPPFPCRPVGPLPPQAPIPPTLGGVLQRPQPIVPPPPNPPSAPPYPLIDPTTQAVIEVAIGPTSGAYSSAPTVVPGAVRGTIVIEADLDLASEGTTPYPSGSTVVIGQPASPGEFTPVPLDASHATLQQVFQGTVPIGGAPVQVQLTAAGGPPGSGIARVRYAVARLQTLVAAYSSSDLDTNGVALATPIPAGPGARVVRLSYFDSLGVGPFHAEIPLAGKLPAQLTLVPGSKDVAVITNLQVFSTGGFGNSVGQITVSVLTEPVAVINPTVSFREQVDAAQNLLATPLVYLPPSYFALAAQGAATPVLAGDFFVTTGSPVVPTTADQTSVLSPGNVVRFAAQMPVTNPPVTYVVKTVTFNPVSKQGLLTLVTPYTGYDANLIDANNQPRPTNETAHAQNQQTAAMRVDPSPATPPSDAALVAALGQFTGSAGQGVPAPPPPNPVVLSDVFARTLSLALAAPVVPQPVALI